MYLPTIKRKRGLLGGGIVQLATIIPKMYLKVFLNLAKHPSCEWRRCVSFNKIYHWLMFGSELTNGITSSLSVTWGCAQRIIWKNAPMFEKDSIVDIIRYNSSKRHFFKNLGTPEDLEKLAINKGILTIHNLHHHDSLNHGKFRFPLLRAANLHNVLKPWFLKLTPPVHMGLSECNLICKAFLKLLDLPREWSNRIRHSISCITDGRKFTSHLLISANFLKF
eukprot:TRINITY_DN3997_c0_g1_i2.p1 TRINITY_DN3997_c0_g1~~TRINITY_DN3997_c0_g1_i2.p1  ORF type:complete len:222 (+),score=-18.13 TRINITY_DN3997_c0_g1_i2:273-938(+)